MVIRLRQLAIAFGAVFALLVSTVVALPATASANGGEPPSPEPVPLDEDTPVFVAGYPTAPDPGFTDVPAAVSFTQGAAWLKDRGITQGLGGEDTYAPTSQVNRGQMALFLWRMMDKPEPAAGADCGFEDMDTAPVDMQVAACWLKQEGVTTGVNAAQTLYGRTAAVNRAQMARFMWRLAGETDAPTSCGFTDVTGDNELRTATCWLKTFGITTGTNAAGTLYSQANNVTRGQMAAFLYRLASRGDAWTPGVLARGSVSQLSAEGTAGQVVSVYTADGNLVDTAVLDAQGGYLWRNIDAGEYLVVVADDDGNTVALAVSVSEFADEVPATVHGQVLREGFNYVAMRDGTLLGAMVTFPFTGRAPYPTLVEYSGYDLSNPYITGPGGSPAPGSSPFRIVAPIQGYALVQVQMRGTGCSGGAFDFFEPIQRLDGYDAIETVANQPWVKGKVGMAGISYPGISQLFVASTKPPSLAAITPVSVIADTARSTLYPGGILNNGFATSFAQGRQDDAEPPPRGQSWVPRKIEEGDTQCADNQRLAAQANDLIETIANNQYDSPELAYLSPQRMVGDIDAAVLLVGAWQDEQTYGHWPYLMKGFPEDTYVRMIGQNGTHVEPLIMPENLLALTEFLDVFVKQETPRLSIAIRLLLPTLLEQFIGDIAAPPGYGIPPDRFTGQSYNQARTAYLAEDPILIRFDNGAGPAGNFGGLPGSAFTMTLPEWPTATMTRKQAWELSLNTDGTLTHGGHTDPDGSRSYAYDPSRGALSSMPNKGSRGCQEWAPDPTDNQGNPCFVWVEAPEQNRASFTTAPLEETTVMVGAGVAELVVTVDGEITDTDIEVALTEIRPDGQEVYIQSGWLRASRAAGDPEFDRPMEPWFIGTKEAESFLTPGEPTTVEVGIFPFAHVFREGSIVRITISAPGGNQVLWNFGNLDLPNHDVTIGTSQAAPSRVFLPVVSTPPNVTPLPPCVLRAQPCRPAAAVG